MKILKAVSIILFISFLVIGCGSSGGSSGGTNEPAIYNATGTWVITFNQTKKVSGDYQECGTDSEPYRSYVITQDENTVSLKDKNGKTVDGKVSGAGYSFSFREMEYVYDEDYVDFTLNFTLSSENNFSGTYRMDERDFFTDYNESFYCITEGTIQGAKRY